MSEEDLAALLREQGCRMLDMRDQIARMTWQPIETAPKDGTWFVICRAGESDSLEVGRYDPLNRDDYVLISDGAYCGLYRKESKPFYDWQGFNNMNRATHWMPLPEPPRD